MGHKMRFPVVCALIACILGAAGCARHAPKPSGRMLVIASIAPLADFAKQVGGNLVDVEVMVPPGASPHTYQIRTDQMENVSRASVLVLNGVGLEYWADKVIDAAGNPKLIVVHAAKGLPIIDSTDKHDPGGNPHVWLDPIYAIRQVELIRDAFIKADPKHTSQYTANADRYIGKLKRLDADIRARVRQFKSKQFIAFHPAWVYFAQRYGLVQAAVIEEWPGKDPPPSKIREIVQTAKRLKVKAIFAEPQLSPKAAQVVAEEAGVEVLMLNPLESSSGSSSYIEMVRTNMDQIEKALK